MGPAKLPAHSYEQPPPQSVQPPPRQWYSEPALALPDPWQQAQLHWPLARALLNPRSRDIKRTYKQAHMADHVQKLRKMPVKLDPRSAFSNERTFLSWINMSGTITLHLYTTDSSQIVYVHK